jgi:hypothetical protein
MAVNELGLAQPKEPHKTDHDEPEHNDRKTPHCTIRKLTSRNGAQITPASIAKSGIVSAHRAALWAGFCHAVLTGLPEQGGDADR